MKEIYLGIDTSNYKTSVALTDGSNNVLFERSEYLDVPMGKRGLRQSEAFFYHSNRLPDFIRDVTEHVDAANIRAVGVSSRPRRVEGSYMPCFLAGLNAAKEIGAVLGIPVYEFSHQEGHAAAVIEDPGCDLSLCTKSLLFHLSGGTTEFLLSSMDDAGYDLKIVGGTKDISIGQLIDRTGVAMGMPFPSGPYMDHIACDFSDDRLKGISNSHIGRIRYNDGYFNLSGTETQMLKAIDTQSEDSRPLLIHELFTRISDILTRSSRELAAYYDIDNVFMAGGVASSEYVRKTIGSKLNTRDGRNINIVFGKPSLSGDNAVGAARLARRIHSK